MGHTRHYAFAHINLRDQVFRDPDSFFKGLPKTVDSLWPGVQLEQVSLTLDNGSELLVVQPPPPRKDAEAFMIGIVREPKLRYFTMERSRHVPSHFSVNQQQLASVVGKQDFEMSFQAFISCHCLFLKTERVRDILFRALGLKWWNPWKRRRAFPMYCTLSLIILEGELRGKFPEQKTAIGVAFAGCLLLHLGAAYVPPEEPPDDRLGFARDLLIRRFRPKGSQALETLLAQQRALFAESVGHLIPLHEGSTILPP